MSLTLEEMSDRELLMALHDVADGEGWASSQQVADQLSHRANIDHMRRSVQVRFSWLVRYGALEREHLSDEQGNLLYTRSGKAKWGQRWRFTEIGEALALGKLKVADERKLDGLKDEQLIPVVRWLTSRQRTSEFTAATLIKREWRYGVSPLRNGTGGSK